MERRGNGSHNGGKWTKASPPAAPSSEGGEGPGEEGDSSLSAGTKKTCRVCKEGLCCQRAGIHYSPQSFAPLLSADTLGFVSHFTSDRWKLFCRTGRCCFFVLFILLCFFFLGDAEATAFVKRQKKSLHWTKCMLFLMHIKQWFLTSGLYWMLNKK